LDECSQCHIDSHSPKNIPMNTFLEDGCLTCHPKPGDEMNQFPSRHKDQGCSACHEKHAYIPPSCMDCHEPHTASLTQDEQCLACHPVHSPAQRLKYAKGTSNDICTGSCHMSLATALPAHLQGSDYGYGANGCTGCHLCPKHHANDHENTVSGYVNSFDQGWYRFLSGHMSGSGHGVEGYEHGMWESGQPNLAPGQANNHNEYLGWEGNEHAGGDHKHIAGFYNLGHTMTAFCCGCHGDFHVQNPVTMSCAPTGTTLRDWTRHPSDAVIPNESEYADTGGAAHVYDPLSPVASLNVDGDPDGTVAPGLDFVMCLSCHRPHGTPYSDLLRWDYGQMVASPSTPTADIGCFYCHTTKNALSRLYTKTAYSITNRSRPSSYVK
jgi:hypothetical protein